MSEEVDERLVTSRRDVMGFIQQQDMLIILAKMNQNIEDMMILNGPIPKEWALESFLKTYEHFVVPSGGLQTFLDFDVPQNYALKVTKLAVDRITNTTIYVTIDGDTRTLETPIGAATQDPEIRADWVARNITIKFKNDDDKSWDVERRIEGYLLPYQFYRNAIKLLNKRTSQSQGL